MQYQAKVLPLEFYTREDVVKISQELLGKVLITNLDVTTAGIITETEAYCAPEDKASHAYNNRRTKRTETMFSLGGISYVYLCYGIHSLFNVVTGPKDLPHAILIRAIQPIIGMQHMLKRRNLKKMQPNLAAGPGTLSVALGINTLHNGESLVGNRIWIEDQGIKIARNQIISGPRVGVGYAKEYASMPWRFMVNKL